MKIKVEDSHIFKIPAEKLFSIISDFKTYPEWWPSIIRFKLLKYNKEKTGSQIKIRPFGTQSFCFEISELIQNKKIIIKYYEGIYRGEGVWLFENSGNKTKVTYSVDLTIENRLTRIISVLINAVKFHSLLMKRVFRNLEKFAA